LSAFDVSTTLHKFIFNFTFKYHSM
jgi:hypothetical protein